MNKNTRWLVTAFLGVPVVALAQPDRADPAAPALPLRYQSAFSDYKPWHDLEPGNWRSLNNAVAKSPTAVHDGHGGMEAAPAASAQAPAAERASAQHAPATGPKVHDMHPMPGSRK